MGDKSRIEWTQATWTPIRARLKSDTSKVGWHCEHESEGCRFCYAEGLNRRLGTGLDFKPGHSKDVEIFLDEKMLLAPLRWRRPRMIFVCSMTDLFADFVKDEWIDKLFSVMALCPHHTFQVLTKRTKRARAYCSDPATIERVSDKVCDMALERGVKAVLIAPGIDPELAPKGARVFLGQWPLPNVWLGCSAEDQENADARIPDLLAAPAAVRFVSAEPLLGPIDFQWIAEPDEEADGVIDALLGCNWIDGFGKGVTFKPSRPGHQDRAMTREVVCIRDSKLSWIIIGGESGPKARPMSIQWAREIRDQCATAGVAFFLKQWGEWRPAGLHRSGDPGRFAFGDYEWERARMIQVDAYPREFTKFGSRSVLERVGKKAAGRLLDGREHNDMPSPPL